MTSIGVACGDPTYQKQHTGLTVAVLHKSYCPIPIRNLSNSEHEQVQSHNYDVDDMQIEGAH